MILPTGTPITFSPAYGNGSAPGDSSGVITESTAATSGGTAGVQYVIQTDSGEVAIRNVFPDRDEVTVTVDTTRLPSMTFTLDTAVAIAGIGGTVTRSQVSYRVAGSGGSVQGLALADGSAPASPLSHFVQDGWQVVTVADAESPEGQPAAPAPMALGDRQRIATMQRGTQFAIENTAENRAALSMTEGQLQRFYRITSPSDSSRGDCCPTAFVDVHTGEQFSRMVGLVEAIVVTGDIPADAVTPDAPAEPVRLIPRTYAQAQSRIAELQSTIAAIQELQRWLDGSPCQQEVHEEADNLSLCGEYEALVCSALGWTPRRGESNSRMTLVHAWNQEVDSFETNNSDRPLPDLIRQFTRRYESGGEVNRAAIDHAESHLESHKHDGFNAIMEQLGLEPMDVEREYQVQVLVERTVTVSQYVTVTRTATNEDEAGDSIDSYVLADYLDDDNWTTGDGDRVSLSTSRYDIDDWTIDGVMEA